MEGAKQSQVKIYIGHHGLRRVSSYGHLGDLADSFRRPRPTGVFFVAAAGSELKARRRATVFTRTWQPRRRSALRRRSRRVARRGSRATRARRERGKRKRQDGRTAAGKRSRLRHGALKADRAWVRVGGGGGAPARAWPVPRGRRTRRTSDRQAPPRAARPLDPRQAEEQQQQSLLTRQGGYRPQHHRLILPGLPTT